MRFILNVPDAHLASFLSCVSGLGVTIEVAEQERAAPKPEPAAPKHHTRHLPPAGLMLADVIMHKLTPGNRFTFAKASERVTQAGCAQTSTAATLSRLRQAGYIVRVDHDTYEVVKVLPLGTPVYKEAQAVAAANRKAASGDG